MSQVYSLLARRNIDMPAPKPAAKPEPHPAELALERIVSLAQKGEASLAKSELVEAAIERAGAQARAAEEATQAAEARAAAHEATANTRAAELEVERRERTEEAQRNADARAAMESQRIEAERLSAVDLERERTSAAALREEMVRLRTTPAPVVAPSPAAPAAPAAPDRFSVDIVRDAADTMHALVLNVGQHRIEVDIHRDGTGRARRLVLAQKTIN